LKLAGDRKKTKEKGEKTDVRKCTILCDNWKYNKRTKKGTWGPYSVGITAKEKGESRVPQGKSKC